MRLIAKEKVNGGRQPELDMLKALCIVCMILLHTYEGCAIEDNLLYVCVDWMCAFLGAAAFMLCMGIGMRLSRRQRPTDYAIRGLELLTVGQLLNLFRNALPNLIAYWIKGDQFFIANAMLVVQTDILSFAGLAFLLLALFKRLKLKDGAVVAVAVAMNLLGWALAGMMRSPSNFLLSQLLGFLVLTDAEAYFPLFSYFVFVAVGYALGGLYPRIADKKGLSARVLAVGLPVCVAYYALRLNGLVPLLPDFYSMSQFILQPGPDAFATTLASLVTLAAFYRLSLLWGGKAPKAVEHLSGNINQYYCVSYMFVLPMQTLLIATRGDLMPGVLLPTLYALFVVAASGAIVEFNNRRLHWHVASLRGAKRAAVFAAIWLASLAVVAYAYPRIETFATFWNDYLLS